MSKTHPLGEVLDITSGYAFASERFSSDRGMPLIRIRDVLRGRTELKFDGDYDPKFLVQNGDLLVSMDGEFRIAEWKGGPALLNQRVCRVEPKPDRLDPRFLLHFLPSELKKIEDRTPFVTVKHLSAKSIKNIEFPKVDLDEQRRIAAILDKADTIRRKREEALILADDFLRSVFLEMFGDPVTNPKGFRECRLDEIADIASGLTKGRKTKEDEKLFSVPYMRVANVQDGFLDLSEIKLIDATTSEIERYALRDGDLLLTEGGDPDKLGRGSVWSSEIENCIHQNHIFRVRVRTNDIHPIILQHQVGSVRGKSYFLKAAKQTTGIASINKQQLSAYPTLIPDRELQVRYLEIIKRFGATRIKLNTAAKNTGNLFAALSQRAYAGDM